MAPGLSHLGCVDGGERMRGGEGGEWVEGREEKKL